MTTEANGKTVATQAKPASKDNAQDNISAALQRGEPPEKQKSPEQKSAAEEEAAKKDAKAPVDETLAKTEEKPAKSDAEDIAALKKELAEMKSTLDARSQKQVAEDFTDSFIREHSERYPAEMLRKLLPVSADRKTLLLETAKIETWMGQYVEFFIKSGRLKSVPLGGAPKSVNPQDLMEMPGKAGQKGDTAYDNIQSGLAQAHHPVPHRVGSRDGDAVNN